MKEVEALRRAGKTMTESVATVAGRRGVGASSLYGWIADYRVGGEAGLGDNYRGRTVSTWTKQPELKKEIEALLSWEPDLSPQEIRDRLAANGMGRPLPSARTIRRFLRGAREPSKRVFGHSRRSFFERYPEVGMEIDALLASTPEASVSAIRDELRTISEKRDLPLPGYSTVRRYINFRRTQKKSHSFI